MGSRPARSRRESERSQRRLPRNDARAAPRRLARLGEVLPALFQPARENAAEAWSQPWAAWMCCSWRTSSRGGAARSLAPSEGSPASSAPTARVTARRPDAAGLRGERASRPASATVFSGTPATLAPSLQGPPATLAPFRPLQGAPATLALPLQGLPRRSSRPLQGPPATLASSHSLQGPHGDTRLFPSTPGTPGHLHPFPSTPGTPRPSFYVVWIIVLFFSFSYFYWCIIMVCLLLHICNFIFYLPYF